MSKIYFAIFGVFSRKVRLKKRLELERIAAAQEKEEQDLISREMAKKQALEKKAEAIKNQIDLEKAAAESQIDAQIAQIQRSTKTSFRRLAPVHNYLRTKSKLYYVWHLNPYSNTLHFGALLFFIGTSIYFIQSLYPVMYNNALAASRTCHWTGATDTSWETSTNWNCGSGGVPGAEDYLYFDQAATYDLIMSSDKTVSQVYAPSAGSFDKTFDTNAYDLTANGDFTWQKGTLDLDDSDITVSGNVDMTGGTVNNDTSEFNLTGSTNTTVNSSKNFNKLTVNKSTSNSVTVQSTFTVTELVFESGIINKNSTEEIRIYYSSSGQYIIGANANGGTAKVVFTYNGHIRALGGTATADTDLNYTGATLTFVGHAHLKNLGVTVGTLQINGDSELYFPTQASGNGKLYCAASTALTMNPNVGGFIKFRSETAGSQWLFDNACGSAAASWLDVKDMNNNSGSIVTTSSINGGNNSGLDFATNGTLPGVKYWIGGTAGNLSDDDKWSTTPGGSNDTTAPTSTQYAYFTSDANANCSLSANTTLAGILSDSYSGTFSTNSSSTNYSLTVTRQVWSSGTFNGNGSTITLTNAIYSGGSFTSTSGNLNFLFLAIATPSFSHNSGTLTSTVGSGGSYLYAYHNIALNNLVLNGDRNNYQFDGTSQKIVVNGTLTLTQGTLNRFNIDLQGSMGTIGTNDGGTAGFGGGSAVIWITGTTNKSFSVPANTPLCGLRLDNTNTTVTLNSSSTMGYLVLRSGNITAGSNNVTMDGYNFILGGTFTASSGTTTFSHGLLVASESSFVANGGTVKIANTSNYEYLISSGGLYFYNLTFETSSNTRYLSVLSQKHITVNGNLVLTQGRLSNGTINLKGDLTVSGANFTEASTTINLNGTAIQTITASAGVLPPLSIEKSTGKAIISTAAGSGNISNNLTLTTGTLEFSGGSSGGNTFTVTDGKTFTTSSGTILRFVGSSGNLATFVSSAPGTRWNIADSGSVYANYVNVTDSNNSSGTIYAMNSTGAAQNNVGWDFTSTAKTWDGGASTTVWGDANNWNPDGVPDANDTVTINSSTANTTVTTNADINFGTLTIGGDATYTNTLTLTNNIGVGGDLTITSNGTFEQKNAVTQKLAGNMTVDGTLTHTANGTTAQGEMYKLMFDIGGNFSNSVAISADGKGYSAANGPGGDTEYGGTYGGWGGGNIDATYGSATNPVSIGSSGGTIGGGAIILNIAGTATINAAVSASGITSATAGNCGSGGSVNISAAALAGSAAISAKGGSELPGSTMGEGGGGGRVKLAYGSSSYTGAVSVAGGDSGYMYKERGFAGTVVINSNSSSSNLTIGGANNISSITTGGDIDYTFGTLIVDNNGALYLDSRPRANSNYGEGVTVNATTLTIGSTGTISSTGLGFSSRFGPGYATGGGSYGGIGTGGTTYGNIKTPVHPGSGGLGYNAGGVVHLAVSGTTTINGTVSSNGSDCLGGSCGSGGSVYITTTTFVGTGTVTANGGYDIGGAGQGPGGGGGRISINYTTDTSNLTTLQAKGGTGTNVDFTAYNGGAGTIFKKSAAETYGNLIMNNNGLSLFLAGGTPIPTSSRCGGQSGCESLQFDTISISSGADLQILTGTSLTIQSNAVIANGSGANTGHITHRGGTLNVPASFEIAKVTINADTTTPFNATTFSGLTDLTVKATGSLSHSYNYDTESYKINLSVPGNLTIESGGSIAANNRGFYVYKGPSPGVFNQRGAGHGGRDTWFLSPTYGSITNPTTLGSGGGAGGANGGGAVILNVTGNITNNGTISADAADVGCSGSGGSVNITANTLTGSGNITANGGLGDSHMGGGGRISLGGVQNLSMTGSIMADSAGDSGTVYLSDAIRANLQIGGAGNPSTILFGTDDTQTDYNFGNITINNGGKFIIGGNGYLNSNAGGASKIVANNITVKSGGSLNANGYGFNEYKGPGYGEYRATSAAYGGAGSGNTKTYGSVTNPINVGSGGGNSYTWGGGAVIIAASGTIDVQAGGVLQANGYSTTNGWTGSGGSVNISAQNITGAGSINANAGTGSSPQGGGGRIAMYSTNSDTFSGSVTAAGYAAGTITRNAAPSNHSNLSPADAASNLSQTMSFSFTLSDPNGDYMRAKLEIADNLTMDSNLRTLIQGTDIAGQTQTSSDITATFNNTSAACGSQTAYTCYANGATATVSISANTPLIQNHTYYWRVSAIDPEGVDSYDGTPHYGPTSTVRSFSISPIDKLVYTAGTAQTIKAIDGTTCSSIMTAEIRNSIDEAVKLLSGDPHTYTLSDGGANGQFFATPDCSGSALNPAQITISSGSSSGSFYYKNTHSNPSAYTLTVSESPSSSWTDATTTIQVNPGNLEYFTLSSYGSTTKTADETFDITVTAKDIEGNTKFDYSGVNAKVWFTASSTADLPYTNSSSDFYTFQPADLGTKLITNDTKTPTNFRLRVVGSQTITLHNSNYDDVTDLSGQGTSSTPTITITPGAAYRFDLSDYPRSLPPTYSKYVQSGEYWSLSGGANENFDMIVTVKDQFNNTKTDYDGSIYFSLYTQGGTEASDYTFTWNQDNALPFDPGTDHGIKQTNGIAGDYSYFSSVSAGKTLDLRISDGAITTQGAYTIYVKPKGLSYFTITPSSTLSYQGTAGDQAVDQELSDNANTPVDLTVTAYDNLGNVKVDYAYNETSGEGRIYFYSPQRPSYSNTPDPGTPLENQEFPYIKTTSNDSTSCFQFPTESAGIHTFNQTANPELFKLYRGGRRTIYVAECITPTDTYASDRDLKDPTFSDSLWDSRSNSISTGLLPVSNSITTTTHVPGSTHESDDHTNNSNDNFTIGPGDQKLTLSWRNPADLPTSPGTDSKIYIYSSTDNVTFTELPAFRTTANGAGAWQSTEVTGLTNNTPYYFKLKLGYKRDNATYLLSAFSTTQTGTPKAIAPLNVSAEQLTRDPEENGDDINHPGAIKLNYQLRFDSSTTFDYFNPNSNPPSWNTIQDSAIEGDKGTLSGNFDTPVNHTTYLELNTDFPEQYLFGSFKVRINVDVAGQGQSNSESNLLTLDTKNPNQTSLIINATNQTTANLTIAASDNSTSLPMEMKVSTQADYQGAEWEAYATTKTNFNIEGASTVYLKFRDLYANETEISTGVRTIPQSFAIKDASNITDKEYRLVLIWKTDATAAHYNIWQSNDGANYTQIKEVTENGFLNINLSSSIAYAYKVTSEDASGNISLPAGPLSSTPGSAPDVTATPAVVLSGWRQDRGVMATITWDTDQPADSNVAYSKGELNTGSDMTTKDGQAVQIAANPEMTLAHKIIIQNLEPSTTYYFKAFSKNEIQIAGYSTVLSFTTPERIPLLIQGMEISDITNNSATASWSTSKLSTTSLSYSSTPISGDSTPMDAVTITDTNQNTDHTHKLEKLTSGTKYYLRAKNTDSDGNTTTSDIYTFSTFALPQISNVSISDISYNSAVVSWTTNVETDSNVEFSTQGSQVATQGRSEMSKEHSVNLIGLDSATAYTYRVISRDAFGNSVTSETRSFTTSSDTTAPLISNLKAEVASTGAGDTIKYQAIISWDTDEPATSQIEFAMGIGGDYTDKTEEILSLNASHVVILPDLKPNSAYHFRIVSKDKVGNLSYSDDISLITPPKEKSLLQVVLKSLEDTFSWVGRLREKWFRK